MGTTYNFQFGFIKLLGDLMSDVRGNIGNSETRILCQMFEGTYM
jgi:hypothetical protein